MSNFPIFTSYKTVYYGLNTNNKVDEKFDYSKTYYKVMNLTMMNYDFQYKLGLNILIEKFNPHGNCTNGGFYFCDLEYVCRWMSLYEYGLICEAHIPSSASVVNFSNKYKTNKIIIDKPLSYNAFITKHKLEFKIY
jgi:hypothetical protein